MITPAWPSHWPAWMTERLVPLLGALALLTDVAFAIGLYFDGGPATSADADRWAQTLMSLDGWGSLLLVLTFATTVTWFKNGRCNLCGFWFAPMLTGYWLFWTILSAGLGDFGHSVLAFAVGGMHALAGLAWPIKAGVER